MIEVRYIGENKLGLVAHRKFWGTYRVASTHYYPLGSIIVDRDVIDLLVSEGVYRGKFVYSIRDVTRLTDPSRPRFTKVTIYRKR